MSLKFIRTPLSLVLAGCLVTAFSARADIVIGVAGPFTGPNATYGDQYWHGATQAAELTPPAALTARRSNWFRGMTPASLSRRWRWPTA
ncbi:hypothetical protein AF40_00550 [Enterobacter roggenkampii MGH 54]|nr:hypothetical protein AF40_00550 [Enterobacter roggenkampii MGH 54]